MECTIAKDRTGWWGVYTTSNRPVRLFDTELECYKYASMMGYKVT